VTQSRQYKFLDGNRIVAYCNVSDIYYKVGNLSVYTNEKYRNKGYGKIYNYGLVLRNKKGDMVFV
jgi:predicted GNAT family acetyltransferase